MILKKGGGERERESKKKKLSYRIERIHDQNQQITKCLLCLSKLYERFGFLLKFDHIHIYKYIYIHSKTSGVIQRIIRVFMIIHWSTEQQTNNNNNNNKKHQ